MNEERECGVTTGQLRDSSKPMLPGRFLALIAACIVGLTGGTLRIELGVKAPTVTVCSHAGSYEIPLDTGGPSTRTVELCCGDCVADDAVFALAAPALAFIPAQSRTARPRAPEDHRGLPWSWRGPPGRAPPATV